MDWNAVVLLGVPATSLIAALVIFLLAESRHYTRTVFNITAAVLKLVLVGWMIVGVYNEADYSFRFTLVTGVDFLLRADALGIMFVGLSSLLWLFTTIYAIGYLENSPNRSRFFGFFSLCVASSVGIALAGNLFTFLLFYELLTLSTYPLVVHRGTPESLRSGRIYLFYTLGGGALLLLGAVGVQILAGHTTFVPGGILADLDPRSIHS